MIGIALINTRDSSIIAVACVTTVIAIVSFRYCDSINAHAHFYQSLMKKSVSEETFIEYMIATDNEDDKTGSVIELTDQEMIMEEIDPVIRTSSVSV